MANSIAACAFRASACACPKSGELSSASGEPGDTRVTRPRDHARDAAGERREHAHRALLVPREPGGKHQVVIDRRLDFLGRKARDGDRRFLRKDDRIAAHRGARLGRRFAVAATREEEQCGQHAHSEDQRVERAEGGMGLRAHCGAMNVSRAASRRAHAFAESELACTSSSSTALSERRASRRSSTPVAPRA